MFNRLFRKAVNPTREWPTNACPSLQVDLAIGSLNGIHVGEPLDRWRFLGPGTLVKGGGSIDFPSHGVFIDVDESGRVDCFGIALQESVARDMPHTPFFGKFLIDGHTLTVERMSGEAQLCKLFGEPIVRDVDGEEAVLSFAARYGRIELESEVGVKGRPKVIVLMSLDST